MDKSETTSRPRVSGEALAAIADFLDSQYSATYSVGFDEWLEKEQAERRRDKDSPLPPEHELHLALEEAARILRRQASSR